MSEHILAYDLGTTGLKTALFKDTGKLVSSVYQEYETYFRHPGWSEQDPREWWRALCSSTRRVLEKAKVGSGKIACVSFTGQGMGVVPVDEKGNLSRKNAIIWTDGRADKQAQLLRDKIGWEKFYSITVRGHELRFYPPARIMWIKKNEPDVFKKTHKFMQVKDYINLRLTGRFVTDFSEASDAGLLNIRRKEWSEEILDAVGIPEDILPELHESTDIVGDVTEKVSKEVHLKTGTPVVIGGTDAPSTLAGAGTAEGRECCIIIGSVILTGMVAKKPLLDRKLRSCCYCHIVPGMYSSFLESFNGGICYRWARDNLCGAEVNEARRRGVDPYKIMDSKASSVQPGANGLLFSPQLRGGGAPYYDPDARGAFVGLRLIHGKGHLLRSILEGVAYTARTFVERLESKSGKNLERIQMIGGGAKSTLWQKIMADVIGRDVTVPSSVHEAGAVGAAMAGGVGIGIFKDFTEARGSIKTVDVQHPSSKVHRKYDEIYHMHQNLYKILKS